MMNKAERTKKLIIEKTASLFNMKGFHGTSMSDITSATGLTKGSIYGNFKNKDELAIEAFRYNLFLLTDSIKRDLSTKHTAIDKLLTFTAFYKENVLGVFERGGCAILNTATDSDDSHPRLKNEVKESIVNWKNTLKTILKEGVESGEFRAIDIEEFTHFFIALVEGSLFLAKTMNNISICKNNIEILEKEIFKLRK